MTPDIYLAYLASIPGVGRKSVEKIITSLQEHQCSIGEYIENEYQRSWSPLSERQRESFKAFALQYSLKNYEEMLKNNCIRVLTHEHKEYPQLLLPLEDRPLVLFAKGAEFKQQSLPLAVVGSRKITPYGRAATEVLINDCMPYQPIIISGCMYGVDMVAHQTALKKRIPTVGVLGFGFNHVYPRSFKETFSSMLDQGATLMTEFAPDVSALPGNFPVRNRIVAGMSRATIVIEASVGSGSLITAQCAVEYGRVVGAVPGAFNSEFSEGTKWLINQGAKLVTSARDIMEELYDISLQDQTPLSRQKLAGEKKLDIPTFDSDTEKNIYETLIIRKDIDTLASELQLSIVDLGTLLTNLELRGLIQRKGTVVERKTR